MCPLRDLCTAATDKRRQMLSTAELTTRRSKELQSASRIVDPQDLSRWTSYLTSQLRKQPLGEQRREPWGERVLGVNASSANSVYTKFLADECPCSSLFRDEAMVQCNRKRICVVWINIKSLDVRNSQWASVAEICRKIWGARSVRSSHQTVSGASKN